ncbi:GNAT family N-acetyltransferase [Clostridium botulinum]|nr:GNAT family N-acetyltransferase [Clostridium botulinum]
MGKVQDSDYEKIKELYTDEKVRKFLGGIVSNEKLNSSFNDMLTCDDNSFYWVVRLKDNNEVIGLASLDKHHDGLSTEVSYQFMPQYWGYGYAEEVVRRIIDYAFDELIVKKIVAETQSANKASCKLLKKVGMSLEQIVSRFGTEQYIFSISKDAV